jgi:selenocysteine lyase/cysteine desulfurase
MTCSVIYLDNAATSWPKPEPVVRALDEFTRLHAGNPGRAAHPMAVEAERRIEEARGRLARLIGAADPRRIAFTLNGTDALNIAIKGLLRTGDHAVMSTAEHNSITRPLTRMEIYSKITLGRLAPDPDRRLSASGLRALLTRPTRLVALAHVSNVLGRINPVAELARTAHAAGALLLVDAAQSIGAVPIDVEAMEIDLLAFPGHKGLFGPMGTGALYVRAGLEPDFFREGGTGVRSESPLHTEEMPMRLEGGTPNAHGLAALAEGLRFVEEKTPARIGEHERALARDFCARVAGARGLTVHTPDPDLGLVGLSIRDRPPDAVAAAFAERGIAVRAGTHCAPGAHRALGTFPAGFVRLSFGFFNTAEHVEAAAVAARQIAAAG